MKLLFTKKLRFAFELVFFLIFNGLSLYGQDGKTQDYQKLKNEYEKFSKEDRKALPIINKLIAKAKKEKNNSMLFLGYQDAIYYCADNNLKLKYADSTIITAFKINNNDAIASAYLGKGIIYYFNFKKYTPALNEYLKAYVYSKNSKNQYLHHKVIYHLGVVKSYLGYYQEAMIQFNQCINYFNEKYKSSSNPNEKYNYKRGYLNSLHQAIVCYRNLNQLKKSDSLIVVGLANTINNKDFALENSYFLKCKGFSQYYQKNYTEALKNLKSSLPELVKINDFSWVSVNYFFQGKCYSALNNNSLAIKKFTSVDSIFSKNNFIIPELRENYEILIDYHKKKKNTDQQLYYMKQLLKADSLISKDFSYLAPKIHREYDTQSLFDDKEKLEKTIINRTLMIIVVSIFSVIAFILFLVRYRREKVIKRKYKLLEYKLQNKQEVDINNKVIKNSDRKISISSEVANEILAKLQKFEDKNEFLKKGLTLNKLASKFATNTYYLSWVVNEHKKVNFNRYINELRISYITNLLYTNKKYLNYTVEALAEECGMASRQNFSDLFYEINGIRPKDFIKNRALEFENSK